VIHGAARCQAGALAGEADINMRAKLVKNTAFATSPRAEDVYDSRSRMRFFEVSHDGMQGWREEGSWNVGCDESVELVALVAF
jgi:hypothetical protein